MKLIIDIPDEVYEDIDNYAKFPTHTTPILRDIVKKGVPVNTDGDTISRSALKEDMKSRLSACNEWIEKAKDKETKIRASAVKAFIAEVIMTIDNAPTVEDNEPTLNESIAFNNGYELGKNERPKGEWIVYGRQGGIPITDYCSNCKYEMMWYKTKYNFCPQCGADMRKGGGV